MSFSEQGLKLFLIKIIFITILQLCSCKMEKRVVGGDYATIQEFPHSVFIEVACNGLGWICGASILNQKIIISAAHCLDECNMNRDFINAYAGSADFTSKTAIFRKMDKVIVHDGYREQTADNDIGLARAQSTFPLNSNLQKLIIPRRFPSMTNAEMAGWGYTSLKHPRTTKRLKTASQIVKPYRACHGISGFTRGMLCAGPIDSINSRPERGDSGSALVTADYKQMGMGLVSFVDMNYPTLIVYTNLTYYYSWIMTHAKILYCSFK